MWRTRLVVNQLLDDGDRGKLRGPFKPIPLDGEHFDVAGCRRDKRLEKTKELLSTRILSSVSLTSNHKKCHRTNKVRRQQTHLVVGAVQSNRFIFCRQNILGSKVMIQQHSHHFCECPTLYSATTKVGNIQAARCPQYK